MAIFVIPIRPGQVRSDLVVGLCMFNNTHVQIYHRHALGVTSKSCYGASVRNADLREASVAFTGWAASICENNG